MKQITLQISYDEEKMSALKIFLAERDTTIEDEIVSLLDVSYKKNVPTQIREFIAKRTQSEGGKSNKK